MSLIDLSRFEGCLFDGKWTPAVERQAVLEPATGHTLFNVGSATGRSTRRATTVANPNPTLRNRTRACATNSGARRAKP